METLTSHQEAFAKRWCDYIARCVGEPPSVARAYLESFAGPLIGHGHQFVALDMTGRNAKVIVSNTAIGAVLEAEIKLKPET